jgi:hypothetical protein
MAGQGRMVLSKIYEALEKLKKRTPPSQTPSATARPLSYEATQKELAEVYFSDTSKARPMPSPTVVRVVEKRRSFMMPWVFTTLALLIMVVALFSTKRIAIDINFLDDGMTSPVRGDRIGDQPVPGTIEVPLTGFQFSKAAFGASNISDDLLKLGNGYSAGSASVYVATDFQPPFRATDYILSFEARGKDGNESLEVIFKDESFQSSLNAKPIYPFPVGLSRQWQRAEVKIVSTDRFNAKKITQLRFAMGSGRVHNAPQSEILIRNLRWKPKRGAL